MFIIGTIIGYAIGSFITTLSRLCERLWRLNWIGKLTIVFGVACYTHELWLPHLLR